MTQPESPFVSFGEATLHIGDMQIPVTDVRWDDAPRPRRSPMSLLAGAGFTDLQAHAVREIAAHEQRYLALRFEGLDDAAVRAELADFTAYAQSQPWPISQSWLEWQTRRAEKALKAMKLFTVDRPSLFGHTFDVALGRKSARWPTALCACHPAPFPAARDYRRRTKHRNRRRR